ncbi:hypothetical protein A3I56_00970 [Candidatus Roizmanbacteria bacterium RIFCSPLOWO2_02_FULL_43_10]|uniref:SGNH hydrolase-type esterase domain-containing protein n=3 Tax=Candidatus Roizmaniibacteriota TaxID=1752723 RepID=A0A1F7JX13_9BACT|nr:MAG: hypothetical protein A3D08_00745 [Candidatus Roizmanbacteria bacterium RIFCSPHIGHO2_02_FULL_43_11]OGK37861.1 MAG: hypothetical protein A3F32_00300 [Candidatus Roizmanbacteria bacterium RIFCSPHIGHO2_12_FULL_42_10]OGK60152.1 MAG: hypothetical protein A3I56_00970 [Candidatus Roizmanbacteria bacterium RIFCSPLOWO2_02_FULL_43_10]
MQRFTYSTHKLPGAGTSTPLHRLRANITDYTVKNHMSLLIGQAIILVFLALIHIGFQYQVVQQEKLSSIAMKQLRFGSMVFVDANRQKSESNLQPGKKTVDQSVVLGTQDESQITDHAVLATPTPGIALQKSVYTIALVGDSMVDTMGEEGDYLRDALTRKYPNVQFVIYNYGEGARNVTQGLEQFHEPLRYKDRNFKSIDSVKPDVIVVGSFAYNPFDPHDRNLHWLQYTRLVQEAQKITPNVYMLAETAPIRSGFGLGPNGVLWDPQTAWSQTGKIIEQLKNVLGLSEALHVPIIDAYTPSLVDGREEGRRELINPSDNIHPSIQGHEMMAERMAEKIRFDDF